jgi:hypothetical protein
MVRTNTYSIKLVNWRDVFSEEIMKIFAIYLSIFISLPALGQSEITPPASAAYISNGLGEWSPATTSSTTGAVSFTPPASGLYCFNISTGQWVPATSSCFGGGGSSFITSLTTTGTSGAATVNSGVLNIPVYSGGGAPSGPAGGDLTGTYPNPTVASVHATSGTLDNVVIGGTTGQSASFSAPGQFPNSTVISTATNSNPGDDGFPYIGLCPNIAAGSTCQFGIGTSLTSGNSGFLALQTVTSGPNYLTFQTFAFANPIQIAGSTVAMPSALMVNNSSTGALGNTCAGGIAFCVNSGSTFTVDTSGNVNAASYAVGGVAGKLTVRGTGTYTTATSDAITVTGATTSSICTFSPTNALAAAATVIPFISSVAANSVTISHVATTASGGTVNIICTIN